jgi:ElaB/YqjD/DUF883 family membrane-anchored ribosome-binding protein
MANDEPEVIRQQMEETRASLTEKLETLEQQVVDTVQGATTAVTETVESVKEAVQETVETVKDTFQGTVETVKDTFDLRRQVDQHPWLMVGGAAALGYAAGSLLPRAETGRRDFRHHASLLHSNGGVRRHAADEAIPPPQARPAEPSRLSSLAGTFGPEIDRLKGLAIGALMGLVRDMVARSAPPSLSSQLTDVMNDFTLKLGGQPLRGSILEESARSQESEFGETRRPMDAPYH